MTEQEGVFRTFMGKRVRDTYGRYVGFVVGISTDPFGEFKGIALDSGQSGFIEIPRACMEMDGEVLKMTPTWRKEAEKYSKERKLVLSRAQAVEELLKEGEITDDEYSETLKIYEGYDSKLQEVSKRLEVKLKRRHQELEREARDLKRMSTNIKIQFKSGEVDAESFRASLQYSTIMRDRVEKEKNDLVSTFNSLSTEKIEQAPQEISPPSTESVSEPSKQTTTIVKTDGSSEEVTSDYKQSDEQRLSEAGWLAKFLKGRA